MQLLNSYSDSKRELPRIVEYHIAWGLLTRRLDMVEFIFVLSFGFTLLTTILANVSNKNWYWVAGLCMYIFSFLASWSIGGYTLSVVFALWALAIGYSLKLIKKFYHAIIAIVVGLAAWLVMINTLDDVWWFLPFSVFLRLTSS